MKTRHVSGGGPESSSPAAKTEVVVLEAVRPSALVDGLRILIKPSASRGAIYTIVRQQPCTLIHERSAITAS